MSRRILISIGTRPEAIKLAPVFFAMRDAALQPFVLATGQHASLLDRVLGEFGIAADRAWSIMEPGQTPEQVTVKLLPKISTLLDEIDPAYVVVQGDTTTAFTSALAAHYAQCPVGHVEAGVRSGDLSEPWPEEMHRRAITDVASHHFAPTETERAALIREGVDDQTIFVTGNTVIDAMHHIGGWQRVDVGQQILVTVHRRENDRDDFARILALLKAQIETFSDFQFRIVLHPNPNARRALEQLSAYSNVVLSEPLGYADMLATMASSRVVLTDSGGLQEEAAEMRRPVVVLRDRPDRRIGDGQGAWFSGRDAQKCTDAIHDILSDQWTPLVSPYGRGDASSKIVSVIAEELCRP